MKTKRKYNLLVLFLSLLVVFHTIIMIMYNLPLNPVNFKHEKLISTYMNPLFTQNWQLFAPDPVSTNNNIICRGVFTNNKGQKEYTEWIDITESYNADIKNNLFSPNRLMKTALSGAVFEVQPYLKLNDKKKNKQLIENEYIQIISSIAVKKIERSKKVKLESLDVKLSIESFPEYGKKGKSKFNVQQFPHINLLTKE
ncbi:MULTISPECIES: DUF5819 family protein [Bacillus]|uniref:DUF5819 family protein n=2 Tax=Bacillus subtilis group TaxID=653685 RepID=A0A9Q4E4U4_BACSC|nr:MULTISPECIES: DUF5819 family protein [Bacillus]MCY8457401.1 DUF5819 family protein [Bacillus spizizenii]AMK71077.1 hypothetical protein AWV81_02445 [Bacillus subtilis subsp. natto]AOR96815.1 hypothetical protein BSBS38_00500 [Bacillus subtilis]AOS66611.1 hypothetical protein A4A60_02505 [Bacillus subtilis]API44737.1 hypothetical protein BSR08_20915 [Bacillus subtilis]